MPRKPPTLKALKKKAWDICSQYIRLKDADSNGMNRCYTCQSVKHYKKLHAGHFVDGRVNSILFDERGIRPQCYSCNMFKGGNPLVYLVEMEREIGQKEALALRDELMSNKRNKRVTFKEDDYLAIIDGYKKKIVELSQKEVVYGRRKKQTRSSKKN